MGIATGGGPGTGVADDTIQEDGDRRTPPRTMSLGGHLRELRSRVIKSLLAVAVGTAVGWIFYDWIFELLRSPIDQVIADAQARGADVKLVMTGIAQAFTLQLQVAATAGVVLAAPVWTYQFWRFVTPGLRRGERRWSVLFAAIAVPLFAGGAIVAYLVLPGGLGLLFGFTPESVPNYVPVDTYLSFLLRMVLVFGTGFLVPLVLVALNAVGILTGRKLASAWRMIIFGVFVFAAVATPTGDPMNLLLLAAPIVVLTALALGFCLINDRRRARRGGRLDYERWEDDEISPL